MAKMSKRGLIILSLSLLIIIGGGSYFLINTLYPGRETAAKEWEIPFLNCVTGPIASIGEYMSWSARRAAAEINENGGIAGKPVKIVIHDTDVKPDKGIEEMGKVIDNRALVVMGPVPEAVIMSAVPLAQREGLFSMTASTSYEYAVKYFPWTLSWYPPTGERLPAITELWAGEHPEMKRVVQFVEKWAAWTGMAEAHATGLERAGVTVEDVEVPTDAVSFGPLVIKALALDPQGIVLTVNAEKAAKIIKELINHDWKARERILVFSSADDTTLYTTGGDYLEGVSIYNYINPDSEDPRWQAFREAYKEDHGGLEPSSLATNYYDAVYMIKEAIENTGITGEQEKLKEERIKIRDYCRNVKDFRGIQLKWDMEEGVPSNKPVFLFEIKGGEKVLVDSTVR